jgi:DNA-binding NarL/FixJ family response regulator
MVDRGFGMHALLEWLGKTRRQFPDTQIIVWAASISDVECFRALQAGARGILRKNSSVPALFHCLKTVARKELWTENLFLSQDSPLGRTRSRPLTPREQQVAELVAKGMKNREIAETLNIATGTVKIHLMHIFEKTGIRDRFELALHGLRLACERAEKGTEKAPQKIAVRPEKAGAAVEQAK